VFGKPINVPHWNDNSLFVLAKRNAAALRKLAIYFNCGQDDNYGFEKGAAALHDELQKEGVKHEYHPYPGDHSLTYFCRTSQKSWNFIPENSAPAEALKFISPVVN